MTMSETAEPAPLATPVGDESTTNDESPRRTPSRGRRLARPVGLVLLAVMLVAVGAGLDRAGVLPGGPATDPAAASPQFALIRQAWDLLHQQYVGRSTLDDTQLAYAAIGALADSTGDTGHTSFETPAELAAEQAVLSGRYVGIGVALEPSTGGAVIRLVFDGSPAARAGLRTGDLILAVDGRDVTGLTITKLSGLIGGPAGSSVTLTIRPAAGGPTRQVTVTREPITIPVVEWAMIPGSHLADVRIDQFSDGATKSLVEALRNAKTAGATGVVLDLRGDPGGLVSEAVGVASQFIDAGIVYRERDASGHETDAAVQPGGVALTTPLVMLVDHGTASAAEIVASAIQDARRALIVGQPTFGTGTILAQFSLADGSALRIGTVEWLTRNGRSTWHVGVAPDQVVALGKGEQPVTPVQLKSMSGPLTKIPDAQLQAGSRHLQP
jgi:carboxyl-terminal processing protease